MHAVKNWQSPFCGGIMSYRGEWFANERDESTSWKTFCCKVLQLLTPRIPSLASPQNTLERNAFKFLGYFPFLGGYSPSTHDAVTMLQIGCEKVSQDK